MSGAPSELADCGAGIGRITKGMLSKHFAVVDLVEPVESFLNQARVNLGEGHQGRFLQVGLEDFQPEPETYDCVWIQVPQSTVLL